MGNIRDKLEKQGVLDLLARIHRDGGHYVAEHGFLEALIDAEEKVIDLHEEVQELKKKLNEVNIRHSELLWKDG